MEDIAMYVINWEGAEYPVTRAQLNYFDKLDYATKATWIRDHKLWLAAKAANIAPPQPTEEYTGGSSSYYMVYVANPTTPELPAYTAECNDIIEALGMNYAEGNAFKAIWRSCAARLGKRKKGYDNGLYDAEKVEFFGKRMVVQSKHQQSKESN